MEKRVKEFVELIHEADFVGKSEVKGCNILMPDFMHTWEKFKYVLQEALSEEGFENYYFPMFIPLNSFKKQKVHYEGFFDELAIIKHIGKAKLKKEMAIRPTSEVVMYESLQPLITKAKLPLKINQFCSVVRWEFKRPNVPLLRDNEFNWQESHSIHSTKKDAEKMTAKMLKNYQEVVDRILCLPVIVGEKPNRRKFAGADRTYAIEALMPDCKSVQLATSHFLGKNFSKPFKLKNKGNLVWQSCHGITTRALGSTIFYHFDEKGLNLPPALAPYKVACLDKKSEEALVKIKNKKCFSTKKKGRAFLEGIPLVAYTQKGKIVLEDRDGKKEIVSKGDSVKAVEKLINKIQKKMYHSSEKFLKEHYFKTADRDRFNELLKARKGFVEVNWCGNDDCSYQVKRDNGASLRVTRNAFGIKKCIVCTKKAKSSAVFAPSY